MNGAVTLQNCFEEKMLEAHEHLKDINNSYIEKIVLWKKKLQKPH